MPELNGSIETISHIESFFNIEGSNKKVNALFGVTIKMDGETSTEIFTLTSEYKILCVLYCLI